MERISRCLWVLGVALSSLAGVEGAVISDGGGRAAGEGVSRFTPLVPLPNPTIIKSAVAYPGGGYDVDNVQDGLADGSPRSEYSSASLGTGTFIDFDFGGPAQIAGFKHIDRLDIATVRAAELIFSDAPDFGAVIARIPVKHANTRGGAHRLGGGLQRVSERLSEVVRKSPRFARVRAFLKESDGY